MLFLFFHFFILGFRITADRNSRGLTRFNADDDEEKIRGQLVREPIRQVEIKKTYRSGHFEICESRLILGRFTRSLWMAAANRNAQMGDESGNGEVVNLQSIFGGN